MKAMVKELRKQAQCYTKVIVGMARAEDQREWKIADRIETLEVKCKRLYKALREAKNNTDK